MATFKICIFKHQRRADDKFPVSIRVCWQRQYAYMKTEFYVTDKQIDKKNFAVKDPFIINELNKRIVLFEELKSKKLGYKIHIYTAKELADYFQRETRPGSDSSIDFVAFSRQHIEKLKSDDRDGTAGTLQRTLNGLIDFCGGREKVYITEITAKFLDQFEAYLKTDRIIKRNNQFGNEVTTKKKGVSDVTVFNYMTDIRTLFNAAMREFNDEDKGDIKIIHYPFRKYKIKRPPESEKRSLKPNQIKKVLSVTDEELHLDRSILARDVFLISFFCVGMNTADIFELQASEYSNGRFTYKRRKTRRRRTDNALISIKVEPELLPLIDKYRARKGKALFNFSERYADYRIFNANVNKGLKKVDSACGLGVKLSTYFARHTWATLARNKCKISKDDVGLALNHVDLGLKTTDIYIEKDWTLIDNANRKVLDYLNILPLPSNNQSDETL